MPCERRAAGPGCVECGFLDEEKTFRCPKCGARLCEEHKEIAQTCSGPDSDEP